MSKARVAVLKTWLHQQPPAHTLTELQAQLDRQTPAQAYTAIPKTKPTGPQTPSHYRLRYDRVDDWGKVSFRRAGRMHHLGIGRSNAYKQVLAIADHTTITVIELHTGEILSRHTIDPDKTYWRNNDKNPGRWPGFQQCPMSRLM